MTDDLRFLGRQVLLAAGVTFLARMAAGVVIGLSTIFNGCGSRGGTGVEGRTCS